MVPIILWLAACAVPRPDADEPAHGPAHPDAPDAAAHVARRPGIRVLPPAGAVPEEAGTAYVVRMPVPHEHVLEVDATAAVRGADEMTWMMPVWTPGSYLVREYAQYVETLVAVDETGAERDVRKTRKNRWTVDAAGAEAITLRYRLYAHETSVRNNWLDDDYAVIVGASTFLTPVERQAEAYDLTVALPEGWTASTGLDAHPTVRPNRWVARDYDELIDSPIIAGEALEVRDFEVDGVPLQLANLGFADLWPHDRAADDVAALVAAHHAFWGEVPYDHYVFLNVVNRAGGGLEHLDSTLMMTSDRPATDDGAYARWLGLVSHEFFHTWNVKRLRPRGLGPFDYEAEVHTPSLWVAEGITSYYDDVLLVRAGLIDGDDHLSRLSGSVRGFRARPGRGVQGLTDASHDAWIKYYRQDAHSVNTQVSYYRKGALVAWLIDAEIRRRTQDRRSLDDALRLAWDRFGHDPLDDPEGGYTEEAFRAVLSETAGSDLGPFLAPLLDGTGPLDFEPALAWFGLRFAPHTDEADPWIGLEASGMPYTVDRIVRDTPVFEAGLNLGDEVIALDGERLRDGDLEDRLARHAPGDEVSLLIARRGTLRELSVTVGTAPRDDWTLERDPAAGTAAVRRRLAWWGGVTD